MRMRVVECRAFSVPLMGALLVLALFAGGGCRRKSADPLFDRDIAVTRLKQIAQHIDPSVRSRAADALARLNNHARDTVPILVAAGLVSSEKRGAELVLAWFDEDQDLLGWCITEERVTSDGTTSHLEERYPVYVGCSVVPLFFSVTYDISIRDAGQRKDERAWQEFILRRQQKSGGPVAGTNKRGSTVPDVQPEESPPVWISIPDPNGVKVFVSVYDRAGHESNRIEMQIPTY